MSRRKIYLYSGLVILVFMAWLFSDSTEQQEELPDMVKVSLREVGNQLLLSNQDTISLVSPVVQLEPFKYQLSFQKHLVITPDSLVSLVRRNFEKVTLPDNYLVEVMGCASQEVAYSYLMMGTEESNIIPCGGRVLPKSCYTIEVKFTKTEASFYNRNILLYLLIIVGFTFLMDYLVQKRKQSGITNNRNGAYASLGSFHFYPEQNKLVKEAVEIQLSKKECELLALFVASPNQIITRDELTKKVWEDNGVFVGRSLDTYISKLRKKLKDDETIKLTNVHGVGYKLEVS